VVDSHPALRDLELLLPGVLASGMGLTSFSILGNVEGAIPEIDFQGLDLPLVYLWPNLRKILLYRGGFELT
jgi:hypothetical protein